MLICGGIWPREESMFGEITCKILVLGMLVAEKVIKQAAVVETATTEAELPY